MKFSALLVATLAACGGGGASAPAAATAADAASAATSASTTSTTTATTTPALEATASSDVAAGTSNSAAVGAVRALSAAATLGLAGVAEQPSPAAAISGAPGGRTFYVDSSAGDDLNDGLHAAAASAGAGPWRSLARLARSDLAPGDVVILACGSQWNETLRLPASGTSDRPIVVRAPQGGCTTRPVIDGSVAIAAAAWTLVGGNIYKAALASVPLGVFATSGPFTEAHHPNRGYLAADPTSPYLAVAADANVVTIKGQPGSTILPTGADLVLPAGATLDAGTRVRIRTGSWLIDETTLTAFNGSKMTLASPTSYPVAAGWGYLLLGKLWMLDSAGEWFYDASAQQLYAWMPDSAAPAAAVGVSVLAVGVDLNQRSYVVVDGLGVRRAGSAIQMRGSQSVRVQNSVIEDIGDIGADAAFSSNAVFESNTFARIGTDAISGQDDSSLPATGMTVRNNVIRDNGVIMDGEQVLSLPRSVHAAIRSGLGAAVTGNAIINSAFVGIRLMAGSTVANNFIFGSCTVLDDCGGIVTWHASGSTIRGNTLVRSRGALPGKPDSARISQAQGIYLDEAAAGNLVEANTVIDTDNGIHLHDASGNTVRGNLLYGNRTSQIWMQEDTNSANGNGDVFGNVITNNQIAAVYPGSAGLLMQTAYASTAAFGTIDGNRYYDSVSGWVAVSTTASSSMAYTLAQWKQSAGVGSSQPVDRSGSSVANAGYATSAIAGSNLLSNSGFLAGTTGWYAWNQTAPLGTLTREACAAGICLRYVGGASSGLVISPSFSVRQGQWYRLTVDLTGDQDGQAVQIIVRRGGGGSNGYDPVSDRSLGAKVGTTWGRYSMIFQATTTVQANDPVTGDLGARVDIVGPATGHSISLANMELVPITPDTTSRTSGAIINAGVAAITAACPFAASQPALCGKFANLADDTLLSWPIAVPAYGAVILYGREPSLVDSDGDGIPDVQDSCPGTAPGASVNAGGCAFGQG